ncbi:LEAF RUST 10 DISEASE-RESISTANCE LOCUS RECEPTOR-LIKE PROTEIN KINASE-like 2.3 [Impatiens glandulifera]|uniref:LEAF RUST 10 DISEASE-RESISTANCE LOCUS RECEPTOR-LIKE PROTEIN KINASE-like 2.3 n=1 Tax=Impatiens glandulifera TaxID=253017 RepID=UPI001FB18026|nr:LEAF RUST 10 DISEASE-RESISTANCE LOCUS RECEPTOR-LIKE PROTEIN KINASE-like 2.3 [Impatiens glandulifera]
MPSSLHLLLSLSTCYFFFFLFQSSNAQESNSLDSVCRQSTCGNVVISSPFWTISSNETSAANASRAYYCGYYGFGIDCVDNQPIFSISNVNYTVQSIDYIDKTFTIVDTNAIKANPSCPRARHNVSIEHLPLVFSSSDLNLTFYFNCSSNLSNHANDIQCLKSGENLSFVFVKGKEPELQDGGFINWASDCDEVVDVTVIDGEIDQGNNLIVGFPAAMKKGFELNWSQSEDCEKCMNTDGRCGVSKLSDGTENFACFCSDDGSFKTTDNHCGGGRSLNLPKLVGLVVGSLLFLCCFGYCLWKKIWFKGIIMYTKSKDEEKLESFIRNHQTMASMRYTYSEIKRITNSFKERLGEGGYGTVYKGKLLNNNRLVAVKILNKTKGSGEDFVNEVSSISRTSHVNIVNLLGFSLQSGKRALVYEFMPNGSLDKFIHKDFVRMGKWEKLRQIATGIARGLEYLHLGCNTRILHFDIKPENILLDENHCPKISDFGLAKMCAKNESIVSMFGARGTIGYIAPEIVSRIIGPVSYKSDVYSYGMLVLEMVGVLKNTNNRNENMMEASSEMYFPDWVHKHLEEDNIEDLLQGDMKNEEIDIARKMISVGLWCVQMDPLKRPHMSKVVEMLEGTLDAMHNPPNPNALSSSVIANYSSLSSVVGDFV